MAVDSNSEQISEFGDTMSTAAESPRSPASPLETSSQQTGRLVRPGPNTHKPASSCVAARRPLVKRPSLAPLDLTGLGRQPASEQVADSGPGPPEATGYDGSELIGSGSVSKVYKVARRSDQRAFAAKHVCVRDEEVQRLARAEYTIMTGLRHDSIVVAESLYENGVDLWIFMEWCADGCVQSHVGRAGAMAEEKGQPLLLQLVEGVDYLHQKRIVHRDLKPDNLYLHGGATALKIGDFNSAKRLESGDNSTAMLTQRGTPLYMAPEVRFSQQWNERVDVWAIGLCAFFMLEASLPFDAENSKAVEALRSGSLPEITWGGVSKYGKNMILQCLEVDMRQRPAPMELKRHVYFQAEPSCEESLWRRPSRRWATVSFPTPSSS